MVDDAGLGISSPRSVPGAVRDAIARGLLEPGDHVLVAVSGGPDSVALLHALVEVAPRHGLRLTVCHVHHGLRAEADRDALFVRALSRRLGCPVRVVRVAVRLGAGRSPEEAARVARHTALGRVARRAGATRVALGHTASDQAETVLMRLLQGAGPRGLAGIPERRGRLVRPLLGVERGQVEAYLATHRLEAVEDASNRDVKFARNRIRHQLLPLLTAEVGPALPAALRRVARASREAVEALDALVRPRLAGALVPTPVGWRLDLEALAELPPGASKALLRIAVAEIAVPRALGSGLRGVHLDALAGLIGARTGARVRLPAGVVVERGREALWIVAPGDGSARVRLAPPGETRLGLTTVVATLGPVAGLPAPDPVREAWFDADVLGRRAGAPAMPALSLRPRGEGERMVPFGGAAPVRVAGLLAGAGVPRLARAAWPILALADPDGIETVLWLVGARRSAIAPITGETRCVLRVEARLRDPRATKEATP